MIEFDGFKVPPDFESDGCTVPFFLRPLYRRYTDACRWHDWARRHLVHYERLTVQEADAAFYRFLRKLGAWPVFARITWFFVKRTRDHYSHTLPVPRKWVCYL